MNKNYTLEQFSPIEGEVVLKKFNDFLKENATEFKAVPVIDEQGTIKVKIELYKKVELVPKTTGTPPVNVEPESLPTTESPTVDPTNPQP